MITHGHILHFEAGILRGLEAFPANSEDEWDAMMSLLISMISYLISWSRVYLLEWDGMVYRYKDELHLSIILSVTSFQ